MVRDTAIIKARFVNTNSDDEKPMTFWRALRQSEFWLLLAGAAGAMFGVPWWVVVPLVMAGLSIGSLPKYIELWPPARDAGADGEWWRTVALSAFNSLGAAVGVYVLGNLTRWLWF